MKFIGVVASSLLLVGCSSTSFLSTWKAPDAEPVQAVNKKVVVVAAGVRPSVQKAVEAHVSDELKRAGIDAIPAHMFIAADSTVDAAKKKLETEGYDAAWVVRYTNKEKETYSETVYAPYGMYGSYWGWGGGWGPVGTEIRTDTNVFVETLIYSVKKDKLVWSAMSKTTNPTQLEDFANELTKSALSELRNEGLLK